MKAPNDDLHNLMTGMNISVENHRITRYSAYVASLIDFQKRSQKLIPVNTDLTSVSEASFLGHFILACKFFMNDDDDLSKSINDFLKLESGKKGWFFCSTSTNNN